MNLLFSSTPMFHVEKKKACTKFDFSRGREKESTTRHLPIILLHETSALISSGQSLIFERRRAHGHRNLAWESFCSTDDSFKRIEERKIEGGELKKC